jgi:hypothetical protein
MYSRLFFVKDFFIGLSAPSKFRTVVIVSCFAPAERLMPVTLPFLYDFKIGESATAVNDHKPPPPALSSVTTTPMMSTNFDQFRHFGFLRLAN